MTEAAAEQNHGGPEGPETTDSPEEPEEPEDEHSGEEGEENSEESIEEFLEDLEAEADNYEAFGTVEELYRAAEEPSNVDEILHEGLIPDSSEHDNIYISPGMAEDLDESFEQIDEALEEDTESGIWARIKSYTETAKDYVSRLTPNDKVDTGLYGAGFGTAALALTGIFPLFTGAGAVAGIGAGAWRSYKESFSDSEGSEEEDSEDYVPGEIDDSMNIKVIDEEKYGEIKEEYLNADEE